MNDPELDKPAVMFNDGSIFVYTQNQIKVFETEKSKVTQVVRNLPKTEPEELM